MHSCYPHNTTWSWCHSDTEELWHQNRLTRAGDLQRHGWWDTQHIEYRFNSHGFRSVEFDPAQPGVMALGCSITVGIGIRQQDSWCERVSGAMGLPCWNLAQPGAAMDTLFRMAEHWIPRLKPRHVIMLCPPNRFEILDSQARAVVLLPAEQSLQYKNPPHLDPFYREWARHPENMRLHDLKNLWAVERLCDSLGIPLHHWTWADMSNNWVDDYGRDLAHPGARGHRAFAERVLREIDAPGVD
jgi:hypothetical protein